VAAGNLEQWQSLTLPKGKSEATFWHSTGAGRGYSALAMKLRASGSRSWFFEYRRADGSLKRMTCPLPNADYQAAERWRLQNLVALSEGHDPAVLAKQDATEREEQAKAEAEGAKTISDLLGLYEDRRLDHGRGRGNQPLKPGYAQSAKRRLKPIRAAWGSRQARGISAADIRDFLDQWISKPAMLEAMEAHLFAFLGWATKQRHLTEHPWPDYERRGYSGTRSRFLDDEELKLLLPEVKAIGYPGRSIIQLALLTARRYSEIVEAEWSEFDLDRGLWVLPGARAKNGKTHALPLSPTALAILKDAAERKAGDGRYVFHRPGVDAPVNNIRADLARCRKATQPATDKRLEPEQREQWTPHDLRRTAASHLEALECPLETIKAILNHSDGKGVTGTYTRSDPLPRMLAWLTKLDQQYEALSEPMLLLPAPSADAAE